MKSLTSGFLLVAVIVLFGLVSAANQEYSFGKKYNWVSINDAYTKSKQQKKPVMVVIHRSWCPACKFLAPKFAESKAIQKLSEKFIMVSLMDSEEPTKAPYCPDGCYTPRILFFDGDGKLLNVVSGNQNYKFYYGDEMQITKSMVRALFLMQ